MKSAKAIAIAALTLGVVSSGIGLGVIHYRPASQAVTTPFTLRSTQTYFTVGNDKGFLQAETVVEDSGYTLIEPTKIILGEPSESEFAIPDYAFDYSLIEGWIKEEDSQGHHEKAGQMREAVRQHKEMFVK